MKHVIDYTMTGTDITYVLDVITGMIIVAIVLVFMCLFLIILSYHKLYNIARKMNIDIAETEKESEECIKNDIKTALEVSKTED
jgi:hypothetical protein